MSEPVVPAEPEELEELQQRDEPQVAVPVRTVEPVAVQILPARTGPVFGQPIPATGFVQVLARDLKRRRAILLLSSDTATDTFEVSRSGTSGSGVPWPANVPLVIEHCDAVWAGGKDATLSVITEVWAD